jgi:ribosome-binding protein aMBF1 (putative translation factor)
LVGVQGAALVSGAPFSLGSLFARRDRESQKRRDKIMPSISPEALRKARLRTGLSQAEVAKKLSVGQPTICRWERGDAEPSSEQATQLNKVLGLSQSPDESDLASPLAEWLKKARSNKDLSVPELAEDSGLSTTAIYRIEHGLTRNLQESTRRKLERALGTELPDEVEEEADAETNVQGLGSLEDFDPHDEDDRPAEPGIYVFYDISNRPIYVGESGNVKNRIRQHEDKFWFKKPIVWSASWIKVEDDALRKQTETLLIKFLKSNAVINQKNTER